MTQFTPSSRNRLTPHDLDRFPSDSLFDCLARAVSTAACLPRKELYENWEMARRVRRLFRGGRVVDVCGGHGLLAHMMLVLDNSSPSAIVIDRAVPPSSARLHEVIVLEWPRLAGRVTFVRSTISNVPLQETDVVVSSHACGALTDEVIDRASSACARVAVLPCCHDVRRAKADVKQLSGWMDGPLAMDVQRAVRLQQRGYRVWTQSIPAGITPKNRLLLASPGGVRL